MKANDIQLFIIVKTLYFEQKTLTKKISAITKVFRAAKYKAKYYS